MRKRADLSPKATPDALLRLIRQRWSIQNEWHWARDAQLGEDAHHAYHAAAALTTTRAFAEIRTLKQQLEQENDYLKQLNEKNEQEKSQC